MGRLKQFEIVFDSEHEVFYPGDTVRGRCVIELRDELRVKTVTVHMRGLARVDWTETQNSASHLAITSKHINSEVDYFAEKQVIYNSGISLAVL